VTTDGVDSFFAVNAAAPRWVESGSMRAPRESFRRRPLARSGNRVCRKPSSWLRSTSPLRRVSIGMTCGPLNKGKGFDTRRSSIHAKPARNHSGIFKVTSARDLLRGAQRRSFGRHRPWGKESGISQDMRQKQPGFIASISDLELASIAHYSGQGTSANRMLRDYIAGNAFQLFSSGRTDAPVFIQSELFLLLSGVAKAPRFTGTVFRAVKRADDVPLDRYLACKKAKRPYVMPAFMATSKSKSVFRNDHFAGEVEFFVHSLRGRDISDVSVYGDGEGEVLFAPGSRFCVLKVNKGLLGRKVSITLAEVDSESDDAMCR
jgi:hypothetical protein